MKVLFFLHPGTNSRGLMVDVIQGFALAGHKTVIWNTADAATAIHANPNQEVAIRESVSAQLAKIVVDGNIGLSVGMWSNGPCMTIATRENGRMVTFFERVKLPHLMTWLDSPERAHREKMRPSFKTGFFKLPYLFSHINNTQTGREMQEVYGFGNVLPRHYGVSPETFKRYVDEKREYDLVFCGCDGTWGDIPNWAKSELEQDEPNVLALRTAVAEAQRGQRQKLAELFPPALQTAADTTIERLAAMQLKRRHQPFLDRVLDLASTSGEAGEPARVMLNEPEIYAVVATQIRRIESFERAFYFVHLSRHFNCGLFGNADYSAMGCGVKSLGTIAFDQQARIYNRGRIGLSVMRWEDDAGYHLKPFEITASGVACAAQRRPGTQELFEDDKEMVRFSTMGEARRQIRRLLDEPARLAAVAEAGRARTLKDHTWATWANEMIGQIKQWQARQTSGRVAA